MVDPLPIELVECIIDNLDSCTDKSTLINCALVGKAWAGASQRRIFHTIIFPIPHSEFLSYQTDYTDGVHRYVEANSLLTALFHGKPVLASYVRCLELRNLRFWDPEESELLLSDIEQDSLCSSLAGVVKRLHNVKKVFFYDVDWDELSCPLRTALTGMLAASPVTELSLDEFYIRDLASLLDQMTHLELLTILTCCDWTISTWRTGTSTSPGSIQLRELVVSNPNFVHWLQEGSCPFGLEKLQSLQIFSRSVTDRQIAFMLQQAGGSLVKLKLEGSSEFPRRSFNQLLLFAHVVLPMLLDPGLVHVGCTPNLKFLELANVFQGGLYTPVPWLRSLFEPFLNSEPSKHSLQYLTIKLRVGHTTTTRSTCSWDHWTEFDQLLRKPEFDSLETVDIRINTPVAQEKLYRVLPCLKISGKLKISITA